MEDTKCIIFPGIVLPPIQHSEVEVNSVHIKNRRRYLLSYFFVKLRLSVASCVMLFRLSLLLPPTTTTTHHHHHYPPPTPPPPPSFLSIQVPTLWFPSSPMFMSNVFRSIFVVGGRNPLLIIFSSNNGSKNNPS